MRNFYMVNEVFYSLQGEGLRAGTPNVFVRFSGCNLTCSRDGEAGFDCDTEFVSGVRTEAGELHKKMVEAMGAREGSGYWCILTGGEPSLQVDRGLVEFLQRQGWHVAIETNGTNELPENIDWVTCSPKSAEHTLRVKRVDELKYVRHYGQGIPRPNLEASHYLISPAFRTLLNARDEQVHVPEPRALEWCIQLVKDNPPWRLSVQQHKGWGVR